MCPKEEVSLGPLHVDDQPHDLIVYMAVAPISNRYHARYGPLT
jgi:hypothetical protein